MCEDSPDALRLITCVRKKRLLFMYFPSFTLSLAFSCLSSICHALSPSSTPLTPKLEHFSLPARSTKFYVWLQLTISELTVPSPSALLSFTWKTVCDLELLWFITLSA
eukprot:TRINITY_DN3731_c0_g1_i7.p3 TRINITY_DN3731_c0_g1~~TRINITY_DN3731_c0_g1_i7.p3  ORF type:complete len:108 (-),score=18.45 TRINITY_DN3731_c0_g1_i7:90-413(-)